MERWQMSSGSSRYVLRHGADLRLSMSCTMMTWQAEHIEVEVVLVVACTK
jgi:hypothetical protein